MRKLFLYVNTIKFLKPKQIFFLILRRVLKFNDLKKYRKFNRGFQNIHLDFKSDQKNTITGEFFEHLNHRLSIDEIETWKKSDHTYMSVFSINYFDYINSSLNPNISLDLINKWVQLPLSKNDLALKPYPTSLRLVNWLKFYSRTKEVPSTEVVESMHTQAEHLYKNLEYELLGNHIFVNAKALLFSGIFLNIPKFYKKATRILTNEINEQILPDGCHFERTGSYHYIFFNDLSDINLLMSHKESKNKRLFSKLSIIVNDAIKKMQEFTNIFLLPDNSFPNFNDNTFDFLPEKIKQQKIKKFSGTFKAQLTKSNFLIYQNSNFKFISDCGNESPSYQPGHFRDGPFAYELYFGKIPIIKNPAISTYENNDQRLFEKSVLNSNSININKEGFWEIWSSFRIARRGNIRFVGHRKSKINSIYDFKLSNYENCSKSREIQREFKFTENNIEYHDEMVKGSAGVLESRIYFSEHVELKKDNNDIDILINGEKKMLLESSAQLKIREHSIPISFNRFEKRKTVIASSVTNNIYISIKLRPK